MLHGVKLKKLFTAAYEENGEYIRSKLDGYTIKILSAVLQSNSVGEKTLDFAARIISKNFCSTLSQYFADVYSPFNEHNRRTTKKTFLDIMS